jgi:hypothetical protein
MTEPEPEPHPMLAEWLALANPTPAERDRVEAALARLLEFLDQESRQGVIHRFLTAPYEPRR